MLHTIVALRGVMAMAISAAVGAWGLRAHPVDVSDPFLGVIELRSPAVFKALVYGYAVLWFSTPFLGASLVLSLLAIVASRHAPRVRIRPFLRQEADITDLRLKEVQRLRSNVSHEPLWLGHS